MLELVESLQRLDTINRDIREQVDGTRRLPPRLLELRGEFNVNCGQFLQSLTGLTGAGTHARLLSRLQDDFLTMHRMLAEHQQRWTLAEISRDPDGYVASTQRVHGQVLAFVDNALQALAAALPASAQPRAAA